MNALRNKVCNMFKDKHAAEQCSLAKRIGQNDFNDTDVKTKLDKYNIISNNLLIKQHNILSDVSLTVYNDVEFFETIFPKIQQCSLFGGCSLSKLVHSIPVSSINILQRRKSLLQSTENVYIENKVNIDKHLQNLMETEKYVLWMFDEHEANLKEIYNIVFFRWKGVKLLNEYGGALTTYNLYRILISPLVGIFSPIIYFIIPYLIIVFKFKLKISFVFYIRMLVSSMLSMDPMMGQNRIFSYVRIASYLFSAVFYFQSIFSSIDVSQTCNKISNILIDNLNQVISFIDSARQLSHLCWNENFASFFDISHYGEMDPFLVSLKQCKYSWFSNFGKQLKDYKVIKNQKLDALAKILQKTYMIDCILGSVKYKLANNLCYSTPVESSKPLLHMADMYHPAIDIVKAVPNSIYFADAEGTLGRNAIITSPNSSGKSVLIKGIIVGVLMAQTIGVCCSSDCTITPFSFINTQINVPDTTGYESLFEAEMHRCKHTLDKLCQKKDQGFSLIVMDEIFSSTNPVEAVAGAFAVCKKMASYTSNILIFTTHFNYLTKLAKESQASFINYRMGIIHDETSNNTQFTYKIEKGVNKHLLALELLKKSGFDDDIVDDAINIKRLLLSKKSK